MKKEKLLMILSFVPLVHMGITFYLVYACYKYHMKLSRFFRSLLLIFGILFLINIPRAIIYQYIDFYGIAYYLLTLGSVYITFVLINLIFLHERNILKK